MPILDKLATPLTVLRGFDQQAFTTTTNGDSIALKGIVALMWAFFCNAYTSGTMTFKVQVSADNSTWVDLDEKYVIRPGLFESTPVDSVTADNQIFKIGISGVDLQDQKYARLVTLGTVVLSGSAMAIVQRDNR